MLTHDEIHAALNFGSTWHTAEWLNAQDDTTLFRAMEVALAVDALVAGFGPDDAWDRALHYAPIAWLAYVLRGLRGSVGWRAAADAVSVGAQRASVPADVVGWEQGNPVI